MKKSVWRSAAGMLAVCSCAWFNAGAAAPDLDPAAPETAAATNAPVDALRRQVAAIEELASGTDGSGKPGVESSYRQNTIQMLGRIDRYLEDRDYRNAIQSCDNITSYPTSAAVRKAIKDLSSAMQRQIKADQSRLVSSARALLTEVPAACAKARNPDELQEFFSQVQQSQSLLGRLSDGEYPDVHTLRSSLSAAVEFIRMWRTCLAAETSGDMAKALESVGQIMSSSSYAAFATSAELNKKLDRLQAAAAEEVTKAIKAARDGLAKAAGSREVQALSNAFSRQYERLRRFAYNDSVATQDMEIMRNLFNLWARVLAAEEKGDIQAALQAMSGSEEYARTDTQLQGLVTAKREALSRQLLDQPPKTEDWLIKIITEQMAAADSVDKLIDLRSRLTALQASYSRGTPGVQAEIQNLQSDLQILETCRTALQARQFAQVLQYIIATYNTHRWKSVVTRHQSQMRARAVSEVFELGDLAVSADQSVDHALLKAADAAAAAKEWEKLARCLDAYRVVAFGNLLVPTSLTDQIAATRYFLIARNFDKAGDLEQAAQNYRMVLRNPAKRAPIEEAQKELARIRKEHPEVFEKIRELPPVPAMPATPPPMDTPVRPPAIIR